MGSDTEAVVDTELRVQGVQGLPCHRRVDHAQHRSRNTNAATIAIAERAADVIRGVEPLVAEQSKAVGAGA